MTPAHRPTENHHNELHGCAGRACLRLCVAADLAVDRNGGTGMIRLRRRVLSRLMSIVLRERRKHEGFEASWALDHVIKDQHILDQRGSEIMIKHFSVLYVGHIELENVGIDGTPADTRRYPNERVIEAFRMAADVAKVMDQHDFYALWMAEHHFQHEGYECIPNLILLGTYLANRIKLGMHS